MEIAIGLEGIAEGCPLAGTDQQKFTISDLAPFRGQSIDSVVTQSVREWLDRSSFNHMGDVVEAIRKSGIPLSPDKGLKDSLATMMSRRHLIAHRADRNPSRGAGHQFAVSISASSVKQWIESVKQLGEIVMKLV
jgi:hypothetical protein